VARRATLLALGMASMLLGCIFGPQPAAKSLALTLSALGLVLASALLLAILREAYRHHRLSRALPQADRAASLLGEPVRLVPGLVAPVVAGFRRPSLYCPANLSRRLDEEELRAVVLHERHHQLARAPLALVVLAALRPFVGALASGRVWLERQRARIEIAADAYALEAGATRTALASALLKLSRQPEALWLPGFDAAAEIRIPALLGEPTSAGPKQRSQDYVALASLTFLVACLLAYLA
jgi:beta-lactamase regulating signal transducer with metallopeptidase domain